MSGVGVSRLNSAGSLPSLVIVGPVKTSIAFGGFIPG
jgi:hypothetical protein